MVTKLRLVLHNGIAHGGVTALAEALSLLEDRRATLLLQRDWLQAMDKYSIASMYLDLDNNRRPAL
jgi:6-phosphogluconate dehydrogenase (decarboxylating)